MDSPAVQHPVMVTNSTLCSYPQNKHGEADYAIWHHASYTPASSVLVVSCDTDTWVYGLGIYEVGYLGEKTVCVQRGNTGEFVDISAGVDIISQHPKLRWRDTVLCEQSVRSNKLRYRNS